MIEETLTEAGFEIQMASSAKQAMELLNRADGKYRVLVIDINFEPGQADGWQIARHARAIPNLPSFI